MNQWWPAPDKRGVQTKTLCPVCKTFLGSRFSDEALEEHCEDCKATYIYLPGQKIPMAQLDSKRAKGCDCFACGGRDVPETPEIES